MNSTRAQSWIKSNIRAVLSRPTLDYRNIIELSTLQDAKQLTPSFRHSSHQAQREHGAVPVKVEAIISTAPQATSTRRSCWADGGDTAGLGWKIVPGGGKSRRREWCTGEHMDDPEATSARIFGWPIGVM